MGRRDPGERPYLELGKQGVSIIVITKRDQGFEANMGRSHSAQSAFYCREKDHHVPDPSILTQRS